MKGTRKRIIAAAIVAITFSSIGGISHATPPGQCKKQGPSDCSGQSECAGPHLLLLPPGWQKKC